MRAMMRSAIIGSCHGAVLYSSATRRRACGLRARLKRAYDTNHQDCARDGGAVPVIHCGQARRTASGAITPATSARRSIRARQRSTRRTSAGFGWRGATPRSARSSSRRTRTWRCQQQLPRDADHGGRSPLRLERRRAGGGHRVPRTGAPLWTQKAGEPLRGRAQALRGVGVLGRRAGPRGF